MAETPNKYSLYQGQKLTSTKVDWGTVASDVTQSLSLIAKDRKDRKQKIKDDTTDALNQLAEVEFGAANSMNGVLLDGSNFSQKTMQNAYDLVSRGVMDISDFQQIKQQQLDGYKSLSNYAKSYSASYESALENVNNGTAAGIEQAMRMSGLKFGNMDNKKLWSDPTTGRLVLVDMVEKKDADGKGTGEYFIPSFKGNEERFITPNEALNFSRYEQKALDLKEDVSKYVTANLGSVVKDTLNLYNKGDGGKDLKSITDFRQIFSELKTGEKMTNPDGSAMNFDQWLTTQAQGIVGNDTNAAEYLFQAGQIEFIEGTRAKGDTDMSKIYFTGGGQGEPVYEVTEAQMELALNLGKNEINSQLDLEVERQKGFAGQYAPQDNATTVGKGDRDKSRANLYGKVNDLVTGDLNSASSAGTVLSNIYNKSRGDKPEITGGIERKVDANGKVVFEVPFSDGLITIDGIGPDGVTPKTPQQIISEIYDVVNPYGDDITIAEEAFEGTLGTNVGTVSSTGEVKFKTVPVIDYTGDVSINGAVQTPRAYLESSLGEDLDDGSNATADEIETSLTNLISSVLPAVMFDNLPFTIEASDADGGQSKVVGTGDNERELKDGYIVIKFGDGNKDYTTYIDGTNDLSSADLLVKVEKAMENARKQYNLNEKPL